MAPTQKTPLDYDEAEGLHEEAATHVEIPGDASRARREWTIVGAGLAALLGVLALIVALVALGNNGGSGKTTTVRVSAAAKPAAATTAVAAGADAPAPTLAQSKGIAFEKFHAVDPTLPAIPSGPVKKFTVDVRQHVTQVAPDLAPTEAWTYAVNGVDYSGVAASPPIVVNQGDKVQITFVNGSSKRMGVTMAHSIDFHAAEVAPSKYYIDIAPGKKETISFVAKHPGVFMYHCATQPILMHTSAGMMGMMVVKPKGLPKVDKELWMTQSEFYLGKPGGPADMTKMSAEKPDVIAFNGYANQYKTKPITVRKGEKIRLYVLNAGPSKWSAFHVIGTVFDRTVVEGVVGHDSQTMNFAPSQGGWAEFTLDQEGNYPFVTHSFGDMVKGAAGILHTSGAPMPKAAPAAAPKMAAMSNTASAAGGTTVPVSLGEFFVKLPSTTLKAGKYTFAAKNDGATFHMLMVERTPLKMDAPNQPTENAAMADTGNLAPGASKSITVTLKPGTYELFCNVPGHYAAGQHTTVTVK